MSKKFESDQSSLSSWIQSSGADIICLQETKINPNVDLEDKILHIPGFESFWTRCTSKKGYSGVVTYVKKGRTIEAKRDFGNDKFDCEGRIMMTDHTELILFNVYFPNSRGGERLDFKMEFYRWFEEIVKDYTNQGRKVVITGDFNTIQSKIDIWEKDVLEEGKYKLEMEWFNTLCSVQKESDRPFIEVFRYLNPVEIKYTWWNNLNNRRQANLGYRIDFFLIDKRLLDVLQASNIWTTQEGSDHCPIDLDLDVVLPEGNIVHKLSSEMSLRKQPKIFQFFQTINSDDKSNAGKRSMEKDSVESHHVNKKVKPSFYFCLLGFLFSLENYFDSY